MKPCPIAVCTYRAEISTDENPQEAQHRTAIEWLASQCSNQGGDTELVVVMPTRSNLNKNHHRVLSELISMSDVRYETKRTIEVHSCRGCAVLLVWPDETTFREFTNADVRLSALAVIEGSQPVSENWTRGLKITNISAS